MAGLVFVDTNLLVYAHNSADARKQAIAAAAVEHAWLTGTGIVSTQVLQEFYVTATRKWIPPLVRDDARQLVAAYSQWRLVQVDTPMILAASELEEAHTISFWDALIVEAARRGGATVLLSEDLQHGRQFGDLEVRNPFVEPSA